MREVDDLITGDNDFTIHSSTRRRGGYGSDCKQNILSRDGFRLVFCVNGKGMGIDEGSFAGNEFDIIPPKLILHDFNFPAPDELYTGKKVFRFGTVPFPIFCL
jgi:hypothetical protein